MRNYYILNLRNTNDISFSKSGEFLLLALSDNSIYQMDFYKLTEIKILNFYGDIKEIIYVDEKILVVKSIKNVVNLFVKK